MKRKIILVVLIILLSGCQIIKKDNSKNDAISKYESYLNTLVEQDRFMATSLYYDISAIMNTLNDGSVRYDVFIENPKIAMYDIEILVVENTAKRTDAYVYPCVGIFNNENYTMIPNQHFEEAGYVQAFQLSGISSNKDVSLNVLITWKDYAKLQTYREFIKLFPVNANDDDFVDDEDVTDDIVDE